MESKAIITSASNKFFPSLINLLGSIKQNYPNHPKIYVYDLGLFWSFRKELESLENVQVLDMPHFCPFWRSCYTWKTYILSHPLAELNFYMDAGCQILRPLDEIFEIIARENYFAVSQVIPLDVITPTEYKNIIKLENKNYEKECITAGIFGFKKESPVSETLGDLFKFAVAGLALGFSVNDKWRNKGVNKTIFVRDCQSFRHDTTLLSMLMRRDFGDFKIQDSKKYGNAYSGTGNPGQLIWNLRLNYIKLDYLRLNLLHQRNSFIGWINRVLVRTFLFIRIIRLFLKGKLWNIINLKKLAP